MGRGLENINAYLSADRRRLDSLFAEALESCATGAMMQARHSFRQFHKRLDQHIALEESTVFPLLRCPLDEMRHEHRQLERLLSAAQRAIDTDDSSGFSAAAVPLRELIDAHHAREERILGSGPG